MLEFAIPRTRERTRRLPHLFPTRPATYRQAGVRPQRCVVHLPASVATFASPDEFVKILKQHGFIDVRAVPLTLGIVYLYQARRA